MGNNSTTTGREISYSGYNKRNPFESYDDQLADQSDPFRPRGQPGQFNGDLLIDERQHDLNFDRASWPMDRMSTANMTKRTAGRKGQPKGHEDANSDYGSFDQEDHISGLEPKAAADQVINELDRIMEHSRPAAIGSALRPLSSSIPMTNSGQNGLGMSATRSTNGTRFQHPPGKLPSYDMEEQELINSIESEYEFEDHPKGRARR